MTQRLGATIPFPGTDVREACELAKVAEDLGYTDVWSAEVSGPDGFSMASAAGISTSSARLGCAIAPAFTRPPALIAMSALAAQQASGGRFCLGLGASTPTIVTEWMGVPFERPLARMRETVTTVRALLGGEKVTLDGESIAVHGFRLEQPAVTPVPIFLAALGPKMLALADEVADGVALFLTSEEGIRLAAKAAPGKEIIARVICCPGRPVNEVKDFARWMLAPYIAANGYNPWLARQGFEDEASEVQTLWRSGERTAAREAVSDRLIESIVVMGGPEDCKEQLAAFYDAGLTTAILLFATESGPAASRAALEAMAPT
ncbi:MAG TPA: LLM class F420-dependent oxidoreductase [Actinomycetota bacterium]|nr:LLM class F420-dependent oxidoreductase [Actinomycetota bacterium]